MMQPGVAAHARRPVMHHQAHAVLPALLVPGAEAHLTALAMTLGGVFASGLIWTWAATSFALRGELLKALRNE